MKNVHSSDGLAEDLIRSFVQMAIAEQHVKTLIEKRVSELENALIDIDDLNEIAKNGEELINLKSDLQCYATLRRADMLYLYKIYGEKGNKEMWCTVKHLAIAMYTAFEAFQASENDEYLLDLALEKNKSFIRALSQFLGVEITECASCFADILKGGIENGDTSNPM